MITAWYRGCLNNEELKKERKALLLASTPALNVLKDILIDQLKTLEANEIATDVYNTPSWAYAQADINGCKRTYKRIIDLLSSEEFK
jgi:hypothetical protein